MSNKLSQLSVKELFESNKYIIPRYQRGYAWTTIEIVQLVEDIKNSIESESEKDYHIGTLVVYARKKDDEITYEIIDGQQRFTTILIILSVLKHKFKEEIGELKMNLAFQCRQKSTEILQKLWNLAPIEIEDEITSAYFDILKALNKIEEIGRFNEYFLEKVKLLRVEVPADTDLNHYFEIMNTRGEQLELHEVLKAKCLSFLSKNEDDKKMFNLIWEACSNMDQYLQYGFDVKYRESIFGVKYSTFNLGNFDELKEILNPVKPKTSTTEPGNSEIEIEDITVLGIITSSNKNISLSLDKEKPERFNSIINFPNFLLQVLKIQVPKKDVASISLDDKSLMKNFDPYLKTENFAKDFAFNLLKLRFLFDKYIVKREFSNGNDNWSLKQYKYKEKQSSYVNVFKEEDNRNIIMIQSMFQVSFPSQTYKYWLNACLKFLFEKSSDIDSSSHIKPSDYIEFLERLGEFFLRYRFLTETPSDYDRIIYREEELNNNDKLCEGKLHEGTGVENFIFNYLDYKLWKKNSTKDEKIEKFIFTFRSSVEHYYPQNPYNGIAQSLENVLNNFGNLCLISSSTNSILGNRSPMDKKEYYKKNKTSIDSIKQYLMMQYESWGVDEIKTHGNEMRKLLGLEIESEK